MKNLGRTRNAQISIPASVAVGTLAGQVVPIGADGLHGLTLTDRVTTAQLNDYSRNLPQGLKNGEASVELIGISTSVRLTVAGTAALGARVYRNAGGTYDLVNTGAAIGYALEVSPSAGAVIEVGLTRS